MIVINEYSVAEVRHLDISTHHLLTLCTTILTVEYNSKYIFV